MNDELIDRLTSRGYEVRQKRYGDGTRQFEVRAYARIPAWLWIALLACDARFIYAAVKGGPDAATWFFAVLTALLLVCGRTPRFRMRFKYPACDTHTVAVYRRQDLDEEIASVTNIVAETRPERAMYSCEETRYDIIQEGRDI